MTCIGNSGPLPETVVEAIEKVKKIIWFFMREILDDSNIVSYLGTVGY
jgi:hypothetical protein